MSDLLPVVTAEMRHLGWLSDGPGDDLYAYGPGRSAFRLAVKRRYALSPWRKFDVWEIVRGEEEGVQSLAGLVLPGDGPAGHPFMAVGFPTGLAPKTGAPRLSRRSRQGLDPKHLERAMLAGLPEWMRD